MPPNVLIVTTHDTGRFIEPYGITTVDTPNLNRLAAEGARFNAYTTAPQCSPSRASLTTGRYPHANGTMGLTHRDFRWDLHPDERTIPQILRTAGYRSGHWGVEHAARDPRRIGNDVYVETRDIEAIVAGVSQFIDADSTRPFVVQVGFGETHRVGGHGFGGQPYDAKGITVPPYLVDAPDTRADLADFQGCVNRADAYIGRLLTILEDRGLLDETLVLYVGDHGIAFPRAKCTLYDPGIEISLIARLPGSPAQRRRGAQRHGQQPGRCSDPDRTDRRQGATQTCTERRCCRWPPARPRLRRDLHREDLPQLLRPDAGHTYRSLEVHPQFRDRPGHRDPQRHRRQRRLSRPGRPPGSLAPRGSRAL